MPLSRHGGAQLYPPDTAYPGSQTPVRFRRTRTSTLALPVRLLGRFPSRRRPPGPRPLCLYPSPYPGFTGTGTDTRPVPLAYSGLLAPVRYRSYPCRYHGPTGTDTSLVIFANSGQLGTISHGPDTEYYPSLYPLLHHGPLDLSADIFTGVACWLPNFFLDFHLCSHFF